MAKIVGPLAGYATLIGTAGDDQIFASGAGNTIYGDGGQDFISTGVGGRSKAFVGTELDGLSGARDVVCLVGPRNTLIGGDETFRVVSYGPAAIIALGNGNNEILAYGSRNAITLGIGVNTVMAGPTSSVLVRSPNPGVVNVSYIDAIQFSGTGNSLLVDAYGQRYPLNGTLHAFGGNGFGTFDVNWSNGDLATGGRGNVVSAGYGTMDIRPGGGGDTVHLSGIYNIGGTSTIHLAGDHNQVDGLAVASTITGGTGFTSIALDAGQAGEGAAAAISLGGQRNDVTLTGFSGRVDAGSGRDTVTLNGSAASVVFHGSGDMAFIQDGGVTIDDLSSGLHIQLADTGGATTVEHFGAARGAVVDLLGSPFTTAAEAFAAVGSDGAGGSTLTFPGSGGLHFAGIANLTAANFKIG